MGASATGAGVTGVAGASVTVAEAASPSHIRGVGVVACAVGAVVKLALGSPNTVDEFGQRERRDAAESLAQGAPGGSHASRNRPERTTLRNSAQP